MSKNRQKAYMENLRKAITASIQSHLGESHELPTSDGQFKALNKIKNGMEQSHVWWQAVQDGNTGPAGIRKLMDGSEGALPSVDQASVDQASVDQASVDQASVDQASVDQGPSIKHVDHLTPEQQRTVAQMAAGTPPPSGENADFTFAEDRKLARYRRLPMDARATMLIKELRNINDWGTLGADCSAPIIESYDPKCLFARIMVSRDSELLQSTSSLLGELCRERVLRMASEPEFAKLLIAVQRFAGTLHVEGQIVLGKDHSRPAASEHGGDGAPRFSRYAGGYQQG